MSAEAQNRKEILVKHGLLDSVLQSAGIPPKDVIRLATIGSAEHLGLDRELGTIARGKRADLLLVPGDPTQDVSVLRKVRLVMKDGAVFFPDEVHTGIGVLPFASRPVVRDSIVS